MRAEAIKQSDVNAQAAPTVAEVEASASVTYDLVLHKNSVQRIALLRV